MIYTFEIWTLLLQWETVLGQRRCNSVEWSTKSLHCLPHMRMNKVGTEVLYSLYIHTHACTHWHPHSHPPHTNTCMHVWTHTRTLAHTHTHTCKNTCTYTQTHNTRVRAHTHTLYTHAHTLYTHTPHTHTHHTHTHTIPTHTHLDRLCRVHQWVSVGDMSVGRVDHCAVPLSSNTHFRGWWWICKWRQMGLFCSDRTPTVVTAQMD